MKVMEQLDELLEVFPSLIPLNGKTPFEEGWQYYCENQRLFDANDFKGRNVGIPCGPANGILVIDVDHISKFDEIRKEKGWDIPPTRRHQTGAGKPHLIYKYPNNGKRYGNRSFNCPKREIDPETGKVAKVFDIKGIGGQVVAPGSIHPDTGEPYKVLWELPIEPAPKWLLDLALQEPTTAEPPPAAIGTVNLESLNLSLPIMTFITEGRPKGHRSEAIASVLSVLTKAKVSNQTIFEIFNDYKIGEKYLEKGQARERWLHDEITRARGFSKKNKQKKRPRGVNLGTAKEKFQHDKEIKFIWREHIPAGMPIMFAGREGDGKTLNALQMAKEIIESTNDGYVVWLATEGAVLDTIDKADKLSIYDDRFVFAEKSDGTYKFEFSRHNERQELNTLLDDLDGPILAVFIDSVRGMSRYGDSDDENGRIMHSLNAIVCDKHKAALIYIDHHKKGAAPTLLDKTSGSTAKTSAVRIVLAIECKSKLVRTIKPAKVNIFKEIPELESIQVGVKIHIRELEQLSDQSLTDRCQLWLTDILSEEKVMYSADVYRLAKAEGFSDGIVKKAKKDLPIKSEQFEKKWRMIWDI